MKKTEESLDGLVVVSAPAPANPPKPPGGGRWRWDGSNWESTDPKPIAPDVVPSNQPVTE